VNALPVKVVSASFFSPALGSLIQVRTTRNTAGSSSVLAMNTHQYGGHRVNRGKPLVEDKERFVPGVRVSRNEKCLYFGLNARGSRTLRREGYVSLPKKKWGKVRDPSRVEGDRGLGFCHSQRRIGTGGGRKREWKAFSHVERTKKILVPFNFASSGRSVVGGRKARKLTNQDGKGS